MEKKKSDGHVKFVSKVWLIIATGLGSGYCPKAPGTAGAVLGLILGYFLYFLPIWLAFFINVLFFFIGCHASLIAISHFKSDDPQKVVIDEVVGMSLALFMIPVSTIWVLLIQFLLFRLFDIFKPFPVKQMEEWFSGGLSIMMDDVVAGIMANIVFRIGSFFLS